MKDLLNEKIPASKIVKSQANGSSTRTQSYIELNGEKYPLFYRKIINDIVGDGSPVIVVNGEMGDGKSMFAARLAYDLHNNINLMKGSFDPSTNLCYEVLPFLRRVNTTRRQCILIDEAGVILNSKDYYDDYNRSNDATLQTMRFKNHCYIYICPNFSDLDKSIRKLCTLKISATQGGSYRFHVKAVENDYESETHDPEIKEIHGDKSPYPPVKLDLPPEKTLDSYREKEEPWKENNLKQNIEKLEKEEEGDELQLA